MSGWEADAADFLARSRAGAHMVRAAVLVAVLFASSAAHAQGLGFVGGGTVDPEQLYVGTFFETPAIGRSVHVRPGVDGSWGGGLRIASINVDIINRSDLGSGWQFYTGGGPIILITRVDDPSSVTDPRAVDDVTGGLAGVIGFAHPSGFMVEFRFGRARNAPSLKFGAGFRIGGSP